MKGMIYLLGSSWKSLLHTLLDRSQRAAQAVRRREERSGGKNAKE
jgi:hypothetical protein